MSDTALAALKKYDHNLKASFPFFLKETLRLKPAPSFPNIHWVQMDMADWLQHGPPRRGIRGSRGFTKTWTTAAYCLWRLYRDPIREKIQLESAIPKNSHDTLIMMRFWIGHIPFLRHLTPRESTRKEKWRDSSESLDVGPCIPEKAPSIDARGFLGALSGTRASLIIPDDVEQDNNTMTRAARVLLEKRAEEFEHIILEWGDICYLGTDHHEESLYEKLEGKGYTFRAWPIRYPTAAEAGRIPGLAPRIVERLEKGINKPGDPLWPERWDREGIADAELRSKHTFQMQRMLIRGLAAEEMYPLKLADLMVFDAMHRDIAPATMVWGKRDSNGSTAVEDIPSVGFGDDQFYRPILPDDRWLPYQGSKAYLDPAGRGKDEMAWAIVSQLHGTLFWKYVNGLQNGASLENLEKVVLSLKEHDARELWIETNFGGEFLIPLIEPIIRRHSVLPGTDEKFPKGWSCAVPHEGVHSSGMKEGRILDSLAPVMQGHRLAVSRQVASDQTTMYQMTRLKRERGCLEHDDRVEAAAGAVAQFKDFLHQDKFTVSEAEKRRERQKQREIFLKRRGITPKPLVWNAY